MNDKIVACVHRAQELNGEARDMEPVPRAEMFLMAALMAIVEHDAVQTYKGDPFIEEIAKLLGAPGYGKRAAQFHTAAEFLSQRCEHTAFTVSNQLQKDAMK